MNGQSQHKVASRKLTGKHVLKAISTIGNDLVGAAVERRRIETLMLSEYIFNIYGFTNPAKISAFTDGFHLALKCLEVLQAEEKDDNN